MPNNCSDCAYAIWDYEEYYGGAKDYYFVACARDREPEDDCPEYRQYEEE
jgi:hypothetical protein